MFTNDLPLARCLQPLKLDAEVQVIIEVETESSLALLLLRFTLWSQVVGPRVFLL